MRLLVRISGSSIGFFIFVCAEYICISLGNIKNEEKLIADETREVYTVNARFLRAILLTLLLF